jgi:putative NIF3 family GTP cyclohydrolase 1 type 2
MIVGVEPARVAAWLDGELDAERYRASEPENGLLVDAERPVTRVAAAANTTFATIAAASDAGAELLLVHHPSWPYIDLDLHPLKMEALRSAGISLYGAHASLDGAIDGTAKALAALLDISIEGRFAEYEGGLAGVHGRFESGWQQLLDTVGARLGVAPEAHRHGGACERVGIVTGAGGLTGWVREAADLGCDTYLTGEGSMYTRLYARERGINLILAGHDLTEAPGVHRLAERTARQFGLSSVLLSEPHIG